MSKKPVPLYPSLALQIFENTGNMIYQFENQKIADCFFRVFTGKNFRRKIDRIFQKHIGFKTTVWGEMLNLSCNAKIIE